MWCTADNHNYIYVTNVQKDFQIRTLIKQLLTKNQILNEIAQNSTY